LFARSLSADGSSICVSWPGGYRPQRAAGESVMTASEVVNRLLPASTVYYLARRRDAGLYPGGRGGFCGLVSTKSSRPKPGDITSA
jgi:hypothetical protein